jgi:hypothetical protein
LCGCEIWLLSLREENKLVVSEMRVLRRIFGPKREEVAGGWRKAHNLQPSASIFGAIKSDRMRWEEHVACIREGERKCTPNGGRKI